jgi:hypothetical protein
MIGLTVAPCFRILKEIAEVWQMGAGEYAAEGQQTACF